MSFQLFIDLGENEAAEPDEPGTGSADGRPRASRVSFRLRLDHDPRAVIPIHATEVRVRDIV